MAVAAGALALAKASAAGYPGAPAAANPRGAQPPAAPGPRQAGNSVFKAVVNAAANLGLGSKVPRPRRRLDNDCPALPENDQTRAARIAEGVSRIPSNAIVAKTLSAIEYTKQDGTPANLQGLVDTFINVKKDVIDEGQGDEDYFNRLLNDLQSFIEQNPDTAELTSALSNQLTLNEANFPNQAVLDELITEVVPPFIDTINNFLTDPALVNPTGDDLTSKVTAIAVKCAELKTSLEANIETLKGNIVENVDEAFYSDKYHGAIEGLLSKKATTVKDLKEKIEEWKELNNCKDKLLRNYQNKVETIRTSMVQEFKALIPKDINPDNINENIETISQLLQIVSQDNELFNDVEKTDVTKALNDALEEIASQIGSKVNALSKNVTDNSKSHTIARINNHASEFSRLNTQVARLSALNEQHLSHDPIDLDNSQSSLSEIKAELINQLFSLNLIKNDGIEVGTIDAIKEIMSKLQASTNDLSRLDTIKKIPQLNAFIESIEQCVNDYSVVSDQKNNLNNIKRALTELRKIINQQADSETEAFPGLNTLLAELEKQLSDIIECKEPQEEEGSELGYIIAVVCVTVLCCCCYFGCSEPGQQRSPAQIFDDARARLRRAWPGNNPATRPETTVFGSRV
jgi:hypothetical protein